MKNFTKKQKIIGITLLACVLAFLLAWNYEIFESKGTEELTPKVNPHNLNINNNPYVE